MRLSYSKINTFKECRKKYFYQYIEKLRPKTKALALMMGEALQNALEALYRDFREKKGKYVGLGNKINKEQVAKDLKIILDDIDNYFFDKGITEPTIISTINAMFQGYVKKHYYNDLLIIDEYIPEYEYEKELFPGVTLLVKIDGLVRTGNLWWIFENKSTSGDPRTVKAELSFGDQGKTYLYGVDKEAEGVIFNVIKKPSIRLKKSESTEDFLKRLIDEYVLTPEKYILREDATYSNKQMEEFEKDTFQVAREMVDCCAYYRTCGKHCGYCPFEPLCSGYGDMSQYDKREDNK